MTRPNGVQRAPEHAPLQQTPELGSKGALEEQAILDGRVGGPIRQVALLGSHLPRQCGIATFTSDLGSAIGREFPALDCFVMAMNETGRSHDYPARVRFEIVESDIDSYRRAADFLNVNGVDVVCIQHEFGIFGGKAGGHLFALMRELRMPAVSTLHTILLEPDLLQRNAMGLLAEFSERVIVMTDGGAELLTRIYGIPSSKIDVIAHGIPGPPTLGASKYQLGVEGKSVLLTFGLLSPDKGIEFVIDAIPAILARCPDAVYVVVGATHPHVKERYGETYRLMLVNRAARLGVERALVFHDRFVSPNELSRFISAADVYVTPYTKLEQSTSGTLAYAVGSGKAVVSTPYMHARELLADGRGVLVPPRDPEAIAREVIGLFQDDERRLAMGELAALHSREMLWPAVAHRYVESFERARVEYSARRRSAFFARTLERHLPDLPEINFEHVGTMTDQTGILQHATFSVPRYEEGYCVDDNARALLLMVLAEDAGLQSARDVRSFTSRYLAYISHAFNVRLSRFRNFMTYSRNWLEECGSEDCHGRALWALGALVGRSADPGRRSLAGQLFHAALPALEGFTSPRAWAYGLLGIDEYLRAFQGDSSVEALRGVLAERLLELFRGASRKDWPWFEDSLSYANARLPHALILSGVAMKREDMERVGLCALDWLTTIQTDEDDYFAPIGSSGVYAQGEEKPAFDQQPIEASAMVAACLTAERVTSDALWGKHALRAFDWFLGQNQLQRPLYDAATGGCRDGLHVDRVNENQGAESTLSFLLALVEMRSNERPEASPGLTE